MGTENVKSLALWLTKHCATPADGSASRYARLRVGRTRKVASQVWKRSPIDGLDPNRLAEEILTRQSQITAPDSGFLEILEIGDSKPMDMIPLGTGEADPDGDSGATMDLENASPAGLVNAAMQALIATNAQLSADIRAERDKSHDLGIRWVEAVAEGAGDKALLAFIDKFGVPGAQNDNLMGEAMLQLAPVAGPVVLQILTELQKRAAERPPPETPFAAWKRVTKELVTLDVKLLTEEDKAKIVEFADSLKV